MAYTDTGLMSPADYAAVSGNNGNGSFADGNGWWVIIFLILAIGGWNGNGGFLGNGSQGAAENYVLTSDFAQLSRQLESATNSIERKGDFIQEQICNSDQMNAQAFSNLNTNILTQGAGLNNTLATNFAAVNQGISNNRYENAIAVGNAQNALSSQFAQCCCDNKVLALQNTNALQSQLSNMNYDNAMAINGVQTSLAGVNYNMATNTNSLQNSINDNFCRTNYNNANNSRDIIDAITASARATQDMIAANRLDDLRTENDRLRTQLNNATLAASQAAQTNEIINSLEPKAPVPAFSVPSPFYYGGCNNGCNCGSF